MPSRIQPKVTAAQVAEAIEAITARRLGPGCDDPNREQLTDEPAELACYVINTDLEKVAHEIVRADVVDALTLVEWARLHVAALPGYYDHMEYQLLELGVTVRLPLERMAPPLGLRSKKGVHNRLLRGRSAAAGGPRNERAERESRREAASALRLRAPQETWAANYGAELLECASILATYGTVLLETPAVGEIQDQAVDPADVLDSLQYFLEIMPNPASTSYPDRIGSVAAQVRLLVPLAEQITAANEQLRRDRRLVEVLARLRILGQSNLKAARRAARDGAKAG